MEQIALTREVIEQWVKEHPIQWEEATADDQYGNEYNIIVEDYDIFNNANLFYIIDEILFEDGNLKYEVVLTDNHRRHKRCNELYVATRNSIEEAKRAVEEYRIESGCEALRIKYER